MLDYKRVARGDISPPPLFALFSMVGLPCSNTPVFPTAAGEQDFIILKPNKMAIFNKGILGAFSGKAGSIVGSSWKGIAVMRSLPGKRTRRQTQIQIDQQEKFSMMVELFVGLAELLRDTFQPVGSQFSGYNAAIAFNIHRAIYGEASPFSLNYAEVFISKGSLLQVSAPSAEAAVANQLRFNWTNNAQPGMPIADEDKVTVAAYCPAKQQWVYAKSMTTRDSGTALLDTSVFAGEAVETWLLLHSKNGKRVSDSVYTGSVLLTP